MDHVGLCRMMLGPVEAKAIFVLVLSVLFILFFLLFAHRVRTAAGRTKGSGTRRVVLASLPWLSLAASAVVIGVYILMRSGPALDQLEVNIDDDLAAWQRMDAVAPADPAAPGWVANAAGSEPWTQQVLGVTVQGRRPGPQGELVGHSPFFEPDREKSREAARRSAIEGLKALSLWRVNSWNERERGIETEGGFLSTAGVSSFLRELFEREFHLLVRGWYDQKVTIRGEPVYRSAVLVRADEKKITDLIREGRIAHFARRREILWTAASALTLALVIFLLYSLLNAGTKGHFAWPLRFLSAGALCVLYLGLAYLKGWFP